MSDRGSVIGHLGGELVLSGEPVLLFAQWMHARAEAARRGGLRDVDLESWTRTAMEGSGRTLAAQRSGIGTSDVPIAEICDVVRMLDPVDTEEARRLLRLKTTRGVISLIARNRLPSARMVSGRYLIERSEVLARAERTT